MWKARLSELEFDEKECEAVLDAIASEWITAGPRTRTFEERFAAMAGTAEAVAVSNGTAALFLALKAAGVGPGDEVLCPALTFVATAAAAIHCGATPVFVDIRSFEDPTMDPVDAARKITSRTKAILPVHYAGIPADMKALTALARTYGLALVEDVAHAPGARYDGRACGSFGDAGCFSLFGNKNITTGEGGMITTNDPKLAERLRLLRSHGMTVNSWDRDRGRPAHYDVVEIAHNFRFDDIRASIGLAQLAKLEGFNRRRAALAECYRQRFAALDMDIVLPFADLGREREPSHHIYPVVFADAEERDNVEAGLREDGIQTSIHYQPIHRFSAFRERAAGVSLPVTEAFASHELTLPLYPSLKVEQIETIVDAVARHVGASGRVAVI